MHTYICTYVHAYIHILYVSSFIVKRRLDSNRVFYRTVFFFFFVLTTTTIFTLYLADVIVDNNYEWQANNKEIAYDFD